MRKRLPHFAELDGIRGLAALAVFFDHFFVFARVPAGTHGILQMANQASGLGYLGVDVFFVLSGFLITSLLLIDRPSANLLHNFYWKRILRIWPVLLVHLLLFSVLLHYPWTYVVLSLLFIVNFSNRIDPGVSGPTWTLSVEEQFYLLWPQMVKRFRIRTICAIALSAAALSVSLRIVVPLVHHGAFAQVYTWYRLDGLGLGAALACQWFAPDQLGPSMRRVIAWLQSRTAAVVAFAVVVALILYSSQMRMVGVGLRSTVVCFVTYRIIGKIVLGGEGCERLKWLAHPVLAWLGTVSYALYMYHGVFLKLLIHPLHAGDIHVLRLFGLFVAALALSLIASQISLVLLERPIQRLRPLVLRREQTVKVD